MSRTLINLLPELADKKAREQIVSDFAALARGDATPGQQRRALSFLIYRVGRLTEMPVIGQEPLEAAYHSGLRSAGMLIAELAGNDLFAHAPKEDA